MTTELQRLIAVLVTNSCWEVSKDLKVMYLHIVSTSVSPSTSDQLDISAEAILVDKNSYVYVPNLCGFVTGRYSWHSISLAQFECLKNLANPT